MRYKTEYRVVEGNLHEFEKGLEEVDKDGFIWCGSMTTILFEGYIIYSQLMSRAVEVKE